MKNEILYRLFIYGIASLAVMGISIALPILPDIERAFNLSSVEASHLISAYSVPGIIAALLSAIFAEIFGRKYIIFIGLIAFSLSGVMCIFSTNFDELLFWRIIQGIGGGIAAVMFSTLVADYYEGDKKIQVIGEVTAVAGLAKAFFPLIGGFLGEISWNMPFYLSILGFILLLIFPFIPFKGKKEDFKFSIYLKESFQSLTDLRNISFFLLLILAFMIFYGTLIYFPSMASERFHASSSQIGILLALASLLSAVVSFKLAWFVKNFSLSLLFMFAGVSYFISQFAMLELPTFLIYLVPLLLCGFAQGLCLPLITKELAMNPTGNYITLLALNGSLMRLGQSLSPSLFGLMWLDYHWEGIYIFGAILSALFIFLVVVALKESK